MHTPYLTAEDFKSDFEKYRGKIEQAIGYNVKLSDPWLKENGDELVTSFYLQKDVPQEAMDFVDRINDLNIEGPLLHAYTAEEPERILVTLYFQFQPEIVGSEINPYQESKRIVREILEGKDIRDALG